MQVIDMFWMKDKRWYYFEGLVPVIREDAPPEVKKSFENYLEQLKRESMKD